MLKKGIEDRTASNQVAIFPNPFSDRVQFFINGAGDRELFITDSKGKAKKIDLLDDQFTLDFTEEEDGVYYCEIKVGDTVFREHLSKQ